MNNFLLFPKLLILKLIRCYQKTFSPDHGLLFLMHPRLGVCKFRPTCSEYAYLAIDKYGILKGSVRAIWRILRCNPWSKGGWDEP